LSDKLKIETVLLLHADNRITVCLSSQVGCALKCQFCATGKMGFKRNLDNWEIVEQVVFWSRFLKEKYPNKKITNLVFMGMGEPFLNYDNVLKAIRFFNDKQYFNISFRKISISTVGLTEGIRKLAKENIPVNLAISLHASNDDSRKKIMPIARKYSLKDVFSATDYYIQETNRRVMLEYLLMDNLNDKNEDALELSRLINGRKLYFVNLIKCNKNDFFKPATTKRVNEFLRILNRNKIVFTQRFGFANDIEGSCGQLITNAK
jgi:23S rRNA (adenine2503-C2)-methyltransferase